MSSAQELCRRLEALQSIRGKHENVWRDCGEHSFVMRTNGLQQQTLDAQQGLDKKARLVDSTATDSGRILASALQAGMTPANARWFGLEVEGAGEDAKRWLDFAAETLHQEIHNANFDAVGMECQLDMVAFGWFVQFIDADTEVGGLKFQSWPVGECFCAASKPGGAIDTVFRVFTLTAEQCVRDYGNSVSPATLAKSQKTPDETVKMLFAIYPRVPYVVNASMGRNMKFAACHVEVDQKLIVRESGYPELPAIVPRWSLIPGSAYAVGPMFDALPDVRELNELKRLDKAAADIAVSGMWIAEDDGVLNPRTIKIGARKVIVANSVDSLKALQTGSDWQLADERISQLQSAIRKLLMADQLQPQDGPAMTATEIHARVALLRQQLGPLFGRMQAEYLQGLIQRCFMLAFRAGVFGPPPQELTGRSFSIKYISPLARAQKLEDVTAIDNFNNGLLLLAEAKPDALDVVDFDKQQRKKAEALGVPLDTMRPEAAVASLRDARAKQQQQAQQQEHAQEMSTIAAKGMVAKAPAAA